MILPGGPAGPRRAPAPSLSSTGWGSSGEGHARLPVVGALHRGSGPPASRPGGGQGPQETPRPDPRSRRPSPSGLSARTRPSSRAAPRPSFQASPAAATVRGRLRDARHVPFPVL